MDVKKSQVDQEIAPGVAGAVPPPPKKPRLAYTNVRRELSEEDLKSPAIQKMLVNDIDRLEEAVADLEEYRAKFHEEEVKNARMEGRLREVAAVEIVKDTCFLVGGLLVGMSHSLWQSQPNGWMLLLLGGSLVICGIVSQAMKRR